MPERDFDPKLKSIAAAIRKMCIKGDVACSLTLVSKSHTEYLNMFPSWSGAQIVPGDDGPIGVRVRVIEAELGREKAKEVAEETAAMLCSLRDIAINNFTAYQQILEMVKERWEINHNFRLNPTAVHMLMKLADELINLFDMEDEDGTGC